MILSFTVNPFNPQELTLGTCKGLYISLHGGVSWKKMKGTLKNAHIIYAAYHPNIKGLLYVITDRGIYTINRSTDSISKTYTFISHKEDAQEYTQNNNCIEFFPSHDDLLLATYAGTIYRSNDRGNTWSLLSHNFGRKNKLINISPALVADIIFIALKDHIVTYNLKTKSIKTISEGLYAAYIYDLVLHNNKESIL